MMRKGDKVYKTLNLEDSACSDDDFFYAMATKPSLIERPIVVVKIKRA